MFLVNSRYPRFAATTNSSPSKSVHHQRHTLSQSYGVNLQSSFTRVLSSALVFSTYLPVSVYGTDTETAPLAAFLGSIGSTNYSSAVRRLSFITSQDCVCLLIVQSLPTCLNRAYQQPARVPFSVPASFSTNSVVQEYSPAIHRLRR